MPCIMFAVHTNSVYLQLNRISISLRIPENRQNGREEQLFASSSYGARGMKQLSNLSEARSVEEEVNVEYEVASDSVFVMTSTVVQVSHQMQTCLSVQRCNCSKGEGNGAFS